MKSPNVMPPVFSLDDDRNLDYFNMTSNFFFFFYAPVDCREDEVRVVCGVPQREDLLVDVLERLLIHDPVGTFLFESSVQGTDFAWKGKHALKTLENNIKYNINLK